MRNPFSKQDNTTSAAGCCAPLTFEEEPAGDQQSSASCCSPLVSEDTLAADTSPTVQAAELSPPDREAAST